jgi:hypothetical protein
MPVKFPTKLQLQQASNFIALQLQDDCYVLSRALVTKKRKQKLGLYSELFGQKVSYTTFKREGLAPEQQSLKGEGIR